MEDSSSHEGDLPGGRLNDDELHAPFSESLAREVREELGPVQFRLLPDPVFIFPHFVKKDGVDALGVAYVAEYLQGNIELSDEHNRFFWASLQKPAPALFTDHMKSAVERLLKDSDRFLMRLSQEPSITLP